jgi:hypothetical protein
MRILRVKSSNLGITPASGFKRKHKGADVSSQSIAPAAISLPWWVLKREWRRAPFETALK